MTDDRTPAGYPTRAELPRPVRSTASKIGIAVACLAVAGGLVVLAFVVMMLVALNNFGSNK